MRKQIQASTSRPHGSNGFFQPSQISASFRRASDTLPPPPMPDQFQSTTAFHDESHYEEVDHLPAYTNTEGKKVQGSTGKSCSLCGVTHPAVRCDMCNSQMFCGPCNDMYHRHPKRHNHIRTLIDATEHRPPLPPRVIPAQGSSTPVRPPRRQKRGSIRLACSQSSLRSDLCDTSMSSSMRFPDDVISNRTQRPRGASFGQIPSQNSGFAVMNNDRNSRIASHPGISRNIPVPVLQMSSPQQERWGSGAKSQFREIPPLPPRPPPFRNLEPQLRSRSVSTSQINKFWNTSANLSHIATMQRKPRKPIICGPVRASQPALPPREFPLRSMHSASVFDMHQRSLEIRPGSHTLRPQRQPQQSWTGSTSWNYPDDFDDSFSAISQLSLVQRSSSPSRSSSASQPFFDPMSTFQSPHQIFGSQSRIQPRSLHGNGSQALHLYSNEISSDASYSNDDPPPPPPPPRFRSVTPRRDLRHLSLTRDSPVRFVHDRAESPSAQRTRSSSLFSAPHQSQSCEVLNLHPPNSWQCEFCTLINRPEANICSVCCKTPSSVLKAKKADHHTSEYSDHEDSRSYRSRSNVRTPPPRHVIESTRKTDPPTLPERAPPRNSGSPRVDTNSDDSSDQSLRQMDKGKEKGRKKEPLFPSRSSDMDHNGKTSRSNHRRQKLKALPSSNSSSSSSNEDVYGSIPLQVQTGRDTPNRSIYRTTTSSPTFRGRPSGRKGSHSSSLSQSNDSTQPEPTSFSSLAAHHTSLNDSSFNSSVKSAANNPNLKTSKGTSPPPQSISTQTYEELPSDSGKEFTSLKSTSRSSLGPGLSSENFFSGSSITESPHEMSDKYLRYSRRAKQRHELKRSRSVHLTSSPMDANFQDERKHLWRPSSRLSLTSDTKSLPVSGYTTRESSPDWNRRFNESSFHATSNVGINYRDSRDTELKGIMQEAIEAGFSSDEFQIAVRMSGYDNPTKWLKDNWFTMVDTIQMIATNFGRENGESNNNIGIVSRAEARDALRVHKGNVWASITYCVEQRRRKFNELKANGPFAREDILTALTVNHGDLDAAFSDLSKAQLKPFLMHVWGPPLPVDNEAIPGFPRPFEDKYPGPHFENRNTYFAPGKNGEFDLTHQQLDVSHPSKLIYQAEGNEFPASEVSEISPEDLPTVDAIWTTNQQFSASPLTGDETLLKAPGFAVLDQERQEVPPNEFNATITPETKEVSVNLRTLVDALKSLSTLPAFLQGHIPEKTDKPRELQESLEISEDQLAPKIMSPPPAKVEELETASPDEIQLLDLPKSDTTGSKNDSNTSIQTEVYPSPVETVIPLAPDTTTLSESEADITVYPLTPIVLHVKEDTAKSTENTVIDKDSGGVGLPGENISIKSATNCDKNFTLAIQAEIPTPSTAKAIDENESVPMESTSSSHGKVSANHGTTAVDHLPLRSPKPSSEEHEQKLITDLAVPEVVPLPSSSLGFTETSSNVTESASTLDDIIEEVKTELMPKLELTPEMPRIRNVGHDAIGNDGENHEPQRIGTISAEKLEMVHGDTEIVSGNQGTTTSSSDKAYFDSRQNTSMTASTSREIKPAVRHLLESGLSETYESAELAVQLMSLNFTQEDSVLASKECSTINAALSFLDHECHLCAGKFSAHEMVSMLRCTHWCCRSCAKNYFMVQIRDCGILDATCPFCKEPAALSDDSDAAAEYFNHLDILLRNLLEDKDHEMFQRKLRDWALSKTQNFKWCSKCSSGFITEPLQTRLVCPDCSAVTCAVCLEPWDRSHDHLDQTEIALCDAAKSVTEYLNENSVQCPRCHTKYYLARGGCMHLTCTQCKFEFCSGCSAPFRQAGDCKQGPFCLKLGLHAHHPRNCLFYLRDKDPSSLIKLLQENEIKYLTDETTATNPITTSQTCPVPIQKETEIGLQDEVCGNDAPKGFAGVCRNHYIEYLGLLIWQNHLDPISILSNDDLETVVRRADKKCPARPYGTKEADYRRKLLEVIQDGIPL